MITTDKILVGLSGGVDSSASVLILKEQGYDVTTASIIFSDRHEAEVERARTLALELNTEHHVLDMRAEFESNVISDFCNAYQNGRTPNPCVLCNPTVKLNALTKLADDLNIDKIATGHYANVVETCKGFVLCNAGNVKKDQSYMLYRVPQEILSRLVLPLSQYIKDDVRELALSQKLSSANRPDSQELCFCDDYTEFLSLRGITATKGDFVLPNGKRLPHLGGYRYTVGQRKGLGISYPHPLYVKRIGSDGDIFLSDKEGVMQHKVTIDEVIINPVFNDISSLQLTAKIRSTAPFAPCQVSEYDGKKLIVEFQDPVFAPAKGQSLVLYTEHSGQNTVVGGGIII